MNHIINHPFHYETEKLIRAFFPFESISTTNEPNGEENYICSSIDVRKNFALLEVYASIGEKKEKLSDKIELEPGGEYEIQRQQEAGVARLIFRALSGITGYTPPWGTLTGIRPSKLMNALSVPHGRERAKWIFKETYLVSDEKIELAATVADNESKIIEKSKQNSYSLYIAIPFCPSRCSYCSFISAATQQAKALMGEYVQKLKEELALTAEIAKRQGLELKSIYIGGGTPTALNAPLLKELTDAVNELFKPKNDVEYTIEAGRPDSVDEQKLEIIKAAGAQRISINPQSFSDEVLEAIGRRHTSKQTVDAYALARQTGFESINMDLIAGLPKDDLSGFENSLKKAIELKAENITVHTLAFKRSSFMAGGEEALQRAKETVLMQQTAAKMLDTAGYLPYYMYRQSKTLGNLENVGWALPGHECEYNIQMMEETHTVLACGAGAVSKIKNENGLKRVFNYKYPFEYLNFFEEIIKRKQEAEGLLQS